MKQFPFLIFLLVLLALGAYLIPRAFTTDTDEEVRPAVTEELRSAAYGFSLPYPAGTEGYTLVMPVDVPSGDLLFTASLIATREYETLGESDVPRDGPPAITVSVYRNPASRPAEEWIRESEDANFALALEDITIEEIGGREYATYRYDGLYTNDAYVHVRDGYAYLFTAAYADTESLIRKHLRAMLTGASWPEPTLPASLAHNDIVVDYPATGTAIVSPLSVTGRARGPWFFEASFPLVLTDWDGRIIAEGYATAEGEWMTEEFVEFSGTLEFERPAYGERGTLILKKDNPSGLPERDDAVEVSVVFR